MSMQDEMRWSAEEMDLTANSLTADWEPCAARNKTTRCTDCEEFPLCYNCRCASDMLRQAAITERRIEGVKGVFGPNFDWIADTIIRYIRTGKTGNEDIKKDEHDGDGIRQDA